MTRPYDLWIDPGDSDRSIARLTSRWLDELRKDVNLRQALMVVEVVFGDLTRHRAATKLLECSDLLGVDRWVAGVLPNEATVSNDYDLDDASSSARGLAFSLPSYFVDPPQRLANGFPLSGFGEVSLLVDGMEWNDRRVILRGDMSGGVAYGPNRTGQDSNDGRPNKCDSGIVSFEIRDPRDSADVLFPPFVVDETRHLSPPEQGVGEAYPIVFGKAITVAPHLGGGVFLAAYGHGWDVVNVFRDDSAVAGFTASEDVDQLGTPITTVSGITGGPVADTEVIKVQLEDSVDPIPNLFAILRRAIELFAPHPDQLLNFQLFADAQAKLGVFPAKAYANTQDTIFNWVEGGVLDDFPMVSMVWDSGRWGPIVTDFRAEPVAELIANGILLRSRIGEPRETPKDQVFNDFTLRYAYDTRLDDFTKVKFANPGSNTLCAISEQASGPRPHPVIEAVHIDDDVVAQQVLDWMVAHLTLPTSFVEYSGAGSLFLTLRRGDTVLLTDRDHRWNKARATVERIEYQRGFVQLGLRVWENPFRTA